MNNNGWFTFAEDSKVAVEEQQRDSIKSNLDKILHYERYRNEGVQSQPKNNVVSAVESYFRNTESAVSSAPVESVDKVEAPKVVDEEDLKPSSTTMQFETNAENDVYEDLAAFNREEKQESEAYGISGKGKILIAVYSIIVALILSLVVINSRMLKNLDGSISAYSQKVDALGETLTRVTEEYDSIMSEEAIDAWAKEHGMSKAA